MNTCRHHENIYVEIISFFNFLKYLTKNIDIFHNILILLDAPVGMYDNGMNCSLHRKVRSINTQICML